MANKDDIKFLSNPKIGQKRKKYCRFRKFGIKYSELHPQFEQLREAFVFVSSLAEWEAVLDLWYRHDLPGRRRVIDEASPIVSESCEAA